MERVFLSVLNMSLTASFVIAAIMIARLPLKKAPRVISYALWGVAGFRLVFPFSFESVVSLLPVKANPIPQDIVYQTAPRIDSGITAVDNFVSGSLPAATPQASVNPLQIWLAVGTAVWVAGIVLLLAYSLITIWLLNRRLRGAMLIENNIYEADNLKTPFVLGFLKPRIYLPAGLDAEERGYILLHEQTHIRRRDHMIKQIAYLILCVHWFNPFAWLAFILMCADMELSCDERVLRELGAGIKKAYSSSLLSLAMKRRILSGSPLAFGEGGIKARIKNVLKFKKTSRVIVIAAVAIVAVLSIGFAVNRIEKGGLIEFESIYTAITDYSGTQQFRRDDILYSVYIVDGELQSVGNWRDYKEIGYAVDDFGKFRIYERKGYSIDEFIVVQDYGFMNGAIIYAAEKSDSITLYTAQLTHDDTKQTIELDTSHVDDGWYELCVKSSDGKILWTGDASWSHAGWNTILLTHVNGKDYLMQYNPSTYQGNSTFTFRVFSLDEDGNEIILDQDEVEFSTNPPGGVSGDFRDSDIEGVKAFYRHVNQYLSVSEILLNTDDYITGRLPESQRGRSYWTQDEPITVRDYFYENADLTIDEQMNRFIAWYTQEYGGIILPDFASFDDAALLSYCLTSDGAYSEGSYSELVKRFDNDPLGICRGISQFNESEQNWLCKGLIGEYIIEERMGDLETILTDQSKGIYSQLHKDVIVMVKIGKILDYMTGKTTGTTESFVYRSPGRTPEYAAKQSLAFEVTNVLDSHIETYEDDGGTPVELIVINYLSGAELRFIDPDMEPGDFYEDGINRAQWYLGYFMTDEKNVPITAETKTIPITSDLRGIYNLEASLYVVLFVAV